MSDCVRSGHVSVLRKRWQDKRQRMLARLASMRAAKARKRLTHPPEREPCMLRWHPLSFGVRDELSGDTVWLPLKSTRDTARRVAVVLRHYVPGKVKP